MHWVSTVNIIIFIITSDYDDGIAYTISYHYASASWYKS